MGTEVRALLDRAGPGSDLFVRDERHRTGAIRPMTRLAAALKDRHDIFRESDITGRRARLRSQSGRAKETNQAGDQPTKLERRCLRRDRTSDIHRTPPGSPAV